MARQSRRVAFKNIEKIIINAYQVQAKIAIDKFQMRRRQPSAEKKNWGNGLGAGEELDNAS